MFEIFTRLADWLTFQVLSIEKGTDLANGLHFFIEDTSKILTLLVGLIYVIAFARATLNVEKVRDYLQGKNRFLGYFLGAIFGAITPFCSCSSIPLFMGFVSARIPLGVTLAFLITSPLINEVVVIMLGGILGWKFTLVYIALGLTLGVIAGLTFDLLRAHRWLKPFLAKYYQEGAEVTAVASSGTTSMNLKQRHKFAKEEMTSVLNRIWKWVIIGVGIGAAIHGYIPAEWFNQHFAAGQWWSVPVASLIAIPMYTNAAGAVPVMSSLIAKGVPLGTTLAFCMSAVAVSLPEFTMLKQVMSFKLLGFFALYIFAAISMIGLTFNYIY